MEEVVTPEMVDEVNLIHDGTFHTTASQVRAVLDVESGRNANEAGSSTRRNGHNISPSSFFKIVKKKLFLHPFK